jgi:disulfide bond formation protein DsbB
LFEFERLVGVLTLATVAYVVLLVVSAWARDVVRRRAGAIALVVAAGATLGSLALSEMFDQVPCELCWYQRIFMYPLPLLIGLAIARKSRDLSIAVVGLAALGSLVSIYHLVVQWVPGTGSCDVDNPCSARILDFLGFVSTPAMALTAFIAIAISMLTWRTR